MIAGYGFLEREINSVLRGSGICQWLAGRALKY